MISKHIPANSFYHTCRYIAQKQGSEVLLFEGVRGHDYKLMAKDFEMQQQLRPSKTQSCFHSILSFYPGEKPSDKQMKEIASKYLQDLGIINTQYAVSKHTDKAHLHLHIVANMVNNEGKAISDSWIGLRGKKIAQQLTQKHQLIPAIEKNINLTHLETLNQSEAIKYQIYIAISNSLSHCQTIGELEQKLSKQNIEVQYKYKGSTEEKQGISFKMGDFCFKGSKVDRKFSYLNLEKTLALRQILVLKQKEKQHLSAEFQKGIAVQKQTSRPFSSPGEFSNGRQETVHENQNRIAKIVEILLTPDENQAQISYELIQEVRLKKRKRKSQRHRHY
jgi:Relaxase/Mobilisation nuclease domain